jgi:hypothetical protein
MTKIEELVWKAKIKNPEWDPKTIATETGVSENEVLKILSKSGSAEPERVRLLKQGVVLTTNERNKTYGSPYENLNACAQLWNAYMSAKFNMPETFKFTAEDVAHFMTLVKMSRMFYGSYHADNYIDSATYQAIAGECRLRYECE